MTSSVCKCFQERALTFLVRRRSFSRYLEFEVAPTAVYSHRPISSAPVESPPHPARRRDPISPRKRGEVYTAGIFSSKHLEIFALFPFRHFGLETLDLGGLDVGVIVDELGAERLAEECILAQRGDRLAQALWQ